MDQERILFLELNGQDISFDSFEYALKLCTSVDLTLSVFKHHDEFMFNIIMSKFGEKINKKITFSSTNIKLFDEEILCKVMKVKYKKLFEENGIKIHLNFTGCYPHVLVNNFDKVYEIEL